MSLTNCSRHPDQAAKGVCTRCGDFVCAQCRQSSPLGLCPACAALPAASAPAAGGAVPQLALIVAILCALLSGGLILGLTALMLGFGKGSPDGMTIWNALMGVLYFGIAFGLVKRTPWGYSWSVGTHGINAIIRGFYFFPMISGGKASAPTLILAIVGTSFALHVVGWLSTKAAQPLFSSLGRAPTSRRR